MNNEIPDMDDLPFTDEYYSCLECGREMFWKDSAGRWECPNCKYDGQENDRD